QTDKFRPVLPQYAGTRSCTLAAHSDDTPELISAALRLARSVYRQGYEYRKAGVMLMGLVRREAVQIGLFDDVDRHRSAKLMALVDDLIRKHGSGTVVFGSARLASRRKTWQTKFERLSPRYTTCWDELPVANA